MTWALIPAVSSVMIFLADATTGGIPAWVSIGLTPAVVVAMFLTGQIYGKKEYEGQVKRAEAWEARCNASEERERETYALAVPAIQESVKVTSRMVAYLERRDQ